MQKYSTRALSVAVVAHQDTVAYAAAEHGRPRVDAPSPLFFSGVRRLYSGWTLHQPWHSTAFVDSSSCWILAYFWLSRVSCACRPCYVSDNVSLIVCGLQP